MHLVASLRVCRHIIKLAMVDSGTPCIKSQVKHAVVSAPPLEQVHASQKNASIADIPVSSYMYVVFLSVFLFCSGTFLIWSAANKTHRNGMNSPTRSCQWCTTDTNFVGVVDVFYLIYRWPVCAVS